MSDADPFRPPSDSSPQAWQEPLAYGSPAYGQRSSGQPWTGQPASGHVPYGPLGTVRATGTSILLFVVTLGIYTYVYNYKVHKEMQAHSGRGVGGGVALLLTFLAGIAMPFVTPAEVGSLYIRRGEREPVRGWTGLWFVLPVVAAYVGFFVAAFALAVTADGAATGTSTSEVGRGVGIALGALGVLAVVVAIGGPVVWFVKTNGALNAYWRSLGVPG